MIGTMILRVINYPGQLGNLKSGFRPLILLLLLIPHSVAAQWRVVTLENTDSEPATRIAQATNTAGYSLEIYRDSADAIRSRLTMADGLLNLAGKKCPTYQIDRGIPQNRSINDAPCISNSKWAEFVLGYVEDEKIESSTLRALMLGISIKFRFILENGDYRETTFSLTGSMKAMKTAFGEDILITPSI